MGFTKDEGICRFADEVEALAGTQLSTHLSSPRQASALATRASAPQCGRARLGLSISHCPVALGTVGRGSVRTPSCKLFRGPGMELPDPVRQRLGNFSRTVFSDSNRTGPEYSEGPGEWRRPGAAGMACGGPGVGSGAARVCPDLKWRPRLQLVLRSAGSDLEEGPSHRLGVGLGHFQARVPNGPGGRTVSLAAEAAPAYLKKLKI